MQQAVDACALVCRKGWGRDSETHSEKKLVGMKLEESCAVPSAGLPLHKEGAHWQSRRSNIMGPWPVHHSSSPSACSGHWAPGWPGRLRLHKVLMEWSRTAFELCHLAHYACPGPLGRP